MHGLGMIRKAMALASGAVLWAGVAPAAAFAAPPSPSATPPPPTATAAAAPAPAAPAATSGAKAGAAQLGSAYAHRGTNACTWTVGTAGIEKAFTFSGGTYTMTSFKNTLVSPAREYVTAAAPSAEFRFAWDGATLTGASGGWSCHSGGVSKIKAGGQPALQLDVSLSRPSVAVTKHYIIYPQVALIREWTSYTNTGTTSHELAQPSFLEQKVMGDVVGDTDLSFMYGANPFNDPSQNWRLATQPLTADYARTFDSTDGTFPMASSAQYMPWFSLFDRKTADGIYAGFDYFGNWAAPVGQRDGTGTSLSLLLPNYDAPVSPGQVVTSPKAFAATYKTDLDDMTNRILDWQYIYLWDYTRAPYYTATADEGYWDVGTGDLPGTMQKVFGLADNMRTMGVDVYHRDYGWWDGATYGDWRGEDWKISIDYLAKSSIAQIVYMPVYNVGTNSRVYLDHPDWFPLSDQCPSNVGGEELYAGNPAAVQYMVSLLAGFASEWGDYEWRNDDYLECSGWPGSMQLAQDQGMRAAIQGFLDARPKSGMHEVNSGGVYFGYDLMRFAEGSSFDDVGQGFFGQYDAARIFPTDKLSGPPEGTTRWDSCDNSFNSQLIWAPDMYSDGTDPQRIECVRRVFDLYHYLTAQGVVGRWEHQYHPHATDADANWFERLSGDGQRGIIIYKGSGTQSAVTVYPKGLNPAQSYDVRFEYQPGTAQRTGADLMANGVTLPAVAAGELIWIGLPGHPGAGTDHTPPPAPAHVTADAATNMDYHGVDVTWTAATDNNWVSYYQILRDGQVIGKVAKGTYYFDHSPAASPSAVYAVRTVDGDGNLSPPASTAGAAATAAVADDASAAVTYTGGWEHFSGVAGPFGGTQSEATGQPCHTACQGFSGTQGQYGWGYQDGPAPICRQACQQFSGVQGQDNWSYQEQPTPLPPVCHLACQQFSGVQGQDNWSYQTSTGGVWGDIATYHADLGIGGDCCGWYDISSTGSGTDFSGLVSPRFMLGGIGHDTARAWTAPKDGVIDIAAQAIPFTTGNQSVLTITRNGQPVFGPQTMDGTTTPLDTGVASLSVTAGDVIRFEVQGGTAITFQNLVQWDPDIQYQGDPPPPPPPPPPPFVNMAVYHANEDLSGDGAFWHDANGYLSARLSQPASDRDIARAWTAPRDGVVDITGNVADDLLDTSGAASAVRITQNGQVIWGPQTIAAGDTSGLDASVAAVAVSAGDVIRFEVAAGGGTVAWDPDVTYQGDPPITPVTPDWTTVATFHPNESLSGDGPYWHDAAGFVSARFIQSSLRRDVARTWTAPADGTVDIAGHASGNGAAISITRGGQTVWGPQSAGEVDTDLTGLAVTAGDVIKFQVAAGGQSAQWDPDISYEGGPPPVVVDTAASYTFTGSQVTYYARLGPDLGTAQVLIDGIPDASVNLYAPDTDNYSVPIYTKTFPVAGQHTISVVSNGQGLVDVDGFRAVTASRAVTENTSPALTYAGTGWASAADPAASGGSMALTAVSGDAVSFTFTGASVTWVGRDCGMCGEADVYLDGAFVTRVDAYGYRGTELWQAALFTHSWPAAGKHTLKIVASGRNFSSGGTRIYIDSIQVGAG
jgi:hypothetical protein